MRLVCALWVLVWAGGVSAQEVERREEWLAGGRGSMTDVALGVVEERGEGTRYLRQWIRAMAGGEEMLRLDLEVMGTVDAGGWVQAELYSSGLVDGVEFEAVGVYEGGTLHVRGVSWGEVTERSTELPPSAWIGLETLLHVGEVPCEEGGGVEFVLLMNGMRTDASQRLGYVGRSVVEGEEVHVVEHRDPSGFVWELWLDDAQRLVGLEVRGAKLRRVEGEEEARAHVGLDG